MDPSHPSITSLPHPTCFDPQSSTGAGEYPHHFNCNICLHLSRDPVVTRCGHLFCWPCLYYQLSLSSPCIECPVCKADVQDRIVPLYGCGGGYSANTSMAEKAKFCGIDIPCRPSATRSIAPINRRSEPNGTAQFHARLSAHSGFFASILRFVLASLPPENSGFLSRQVHSAVSLLVHRRRFNNEKEFVLHWMFILMGLVAIAIFLAC